MTGGKSVHESWVITEPRKIYQLPHTKSWNLPLPKNLQEAHHVLRDAGSHQSRNGKDLVEMLS